MLYKEIPFLQLTIALAAGIVTGSIVNLPGATIITSVVLLFLIMVNLYDRKSINSIRAAILVFLFLFFSGISLYHSFLNRLITLPVAKSSFLVRAEDYPEQRDKSVRLQVKIIEYNKENISASRNRMMLYFRDTTGLSNIIPGSYLDIPLTPRLINDPDPADSFDYILYMERRGFRYFAFAQPGFSEGKGKAGLKNHAKRLRTGLVTILSDNGLSGDNLALTAALTLGYREMLDNELNDSFRRSGITHILAVSGLHVGILSIIVMSLLSFLSGRAPAIRIAGAISAIWFFAFITGLSPSVTRASLMFTFLYAGRLFQRPVNNLNSLFASAFLVMVIHPPVIFEAGFQLSYSAVIFILLFYRSFYSLVPLKGKIVSKLWSMAVVTILAQLGTLPFVIYYFHSVPLMSLVTNIIAIPSAFIILGGGLISIITSSLPVIPVITSCITEKSTALLIYTAERISSLPFSSVTTGNITTPLFISLLVMIPLATSYLLRKESVHPHLMLTSVIITVITSAI